MGGAGPDTTGQTAAQTVHFMEQANLASPAGFKSIDPTSAHREQRQSDICGAHCLPSNQHVPPNCLHSWARPPSAWSNPEEEPVSFPTSSHSSTAFNRAKRAYDLCVSIEPGARGQGPFEPSSASMYPSAAVLARKDTTMLFERAHQWRDIALCARLLGCAPLDCIYLRASQHRPRRSHRRQAQWYCDGGGGATGCI